MYNCAVDEHRGPGSPLDDPGFLDDLSLLDEGLDSKNVIPRRTDPPGPSRPGLLVPPLQKRPARSTVPLSLPESITAPFDALLVPETPADREAAARRRPDEPVRQPAPRADRRQPEPARAPADACERFYGLSEKPFALSADPRFFYHSRSHDAVNQQLLTAIRNREALVVLTGDLGMGKTILCRTVIEQLDRRTLISFVDNPFMSGDQLLRTVLEDFGVLSHDDDPGAQGATGDELNAALRSFVASLVPLEASAVVIIDEAHKLPADVVERVRLLTESSGVPALNVVLVGQPSLAALLRRAEHKSLQQRVALSAVLGPLPADEVRAYVMHRLAVAGAAPDFQFEDAALARIGHLSHGVPRVVNLLCDRALARGFESGARAIDTALVEGAAEDLDLGDGRAKLRAIAARIALYLALALCGLAGAGAAAWVFRDAVSRTVGQWQRVPPSPQPPPGFRPGPTTPPRR